MAILTASTLSLPYSFTAGTSADAGQVNSNFTNTQTQVNNLVTDTQTLNTATSQLSSNNTYTGTNTFRHIYFTSTYGIGDSFILLDSDNAGAEADQSIRFNRGSTSATPARFTYDSTNHLYRFTTDNDTTLAIIRHADGAASTDGVTYGQVGKLATTNTWALVNTYTVYPEIASYVAPTTNTQFAPKKYVDDQTASLVTGGVLQQTSAPATTANNLWINTTSTSNYELFRANGSVFAPVTGIFQGTSAPTTPTPATGRLWLDTTTSASTSLKYYTGSAWKQCIPATIDAATAFTASVTFNGGFSVAASQTISMGSNKITDVTDPASAQDAATKAYVDALTPRKWAATAAVTVNNTTPATLIGTGSGTYSKSGNAIIVPANTFSAGTTMRITAMGVYTRGTGTLDLSLGIGGQAIGTFSIGDPGTATSNASWKIESIVTNVTTGAPGTFYGQSVFSRGSTGAGTNWNVSGTGSSSTFNLATTTTQDVTFLATWSATAGSVTCTNFIIEII